MWLIWQRISVPWPKSDATAAYNGWYEDHHHDPTALITRHRGLARESAVMSASTSPGVYRHSADHPPRQPAHERGLLRRAPTVWRSGEDSSIQNTAYSSMRASLMR
jgi:hypothetical protein